MKVVEIEVLIELLLGGYFWLTLRQMRSWWIPDIESRGKFGNVWKTATTSLRVRWCFDSGKQPSQLANEVNQILSINRINAWINRSLLPLCRFRTSGHPNHLGPRSFSIRIFVSNVSKGTSNKKGLGLDQYFWRSGINTSDLFDLWWLWWTVPFSEYKLYSVLNHLKRIISVVLVSLLCLLEDVVTTANVAWPNS